MLNDNPIDARFFDRRCFTKYVYYYEGRGVYTKYGDCLGYYECARRNFCEAMMCAFRDGYDPHNKGLAFDLSDFLERLRAKDFSNPYPHRLCTNGDGGYLEQPGQFSSLEPDITHWIR